MTDTMMNFCKLFRREENDFLKKLNIKHKVIRPFFGNKLILEVNTTIFPKFLHSYKHYNNIYTFTVLHIDYIPRKFIIELKLPEYKIERILIDTPHMNSVPKYYRGQDLFEICVDYDNFNLVNKDKSIENIIQRCIHRINTWNYLDRTVNINVGDKKKMTIVPLSKFVVQKLNQQKREDWLQKVLKTRKQKYHSLFHS